MQRNEVSVVEGGWSDAEPKTDKEVWSDGAWGEARSRVGAAWTLEHRGGQRKACPRSRREGQ